MTMHDGTLDEFMQKHRQELRDLVAQRVQSDGSEPREASMARVDTVIEDIIEGIRRVRGFGDEPSHDDMRRAARQHGRTRKQLGADIQTICADFGAISDSIGELGHRYGASFAAQHYQILNQRVDAAIALALEQYSNEAQSQTERAVAQRIGVLAHELRNALAGVQLGFDILKRNEVGINSRTGDVVKRGLTRLDHLIGQTLLAVRLQVGSSFNAEQIDLGELMRHVEDAAGTQRGIRVVLDVAPRIMVDGDEELLTSAFSNLLQNALKFTRRGGTITIRARHEHTGSVTVEVEDECGGLPPGKKERLFEPFVQSDKDRRGLGLGLTITREAIHVHRGDIAVRDIPGRGCVFVINLPSAVAAP